MFPFLRECRRQHAGTLSGGEQNVRFALGIANRWAALKLGEIVDRGASDDADAAARIEAHLAV